MTLLSDPDGFRADFGRTADDYARHRAGFPPQLYSLLEQRGLGRTGDRVLDLGTGTGTIARTLAETGAEVAGLDVSIGMLRGACSLGGKADYLAGDAHATPIRSASLDLVIAGQCWHWFDPARAFAEVRRVLRPGGSLAICSYDWLPLPASVVEATETLILEHNPAWLPFSGGTGRRPQYAEAAVAAGFVEIATREADVDQPYTHEAWRGRIRASAGVGGSMPPLEAERFDRAHAAMLDDRFPDEPLHTPHRLYVVLARVPEGGPR